MTAASAALKTVSSNAASAFFMSAPFLGVVGGTSILQRLRADTLFRPAAAHSRDLPSVRTGLAHRERSGGRWVSIHGAKNFALSSTGNSTGNPVISSYGGRHVTA